MAKTLLFIVNPRAGRTRSMGPLFEAVAHFGQEGYLVSVRQTTHPGHAAELAEAEGAQVVLVEGTERLSLGEAELTLFPPLGGGTSNESGLFVLCTAGEFDVLITGDADAFVEKMLVKYQPIPDIEVLVAGHHGSKHSSCGEFLQAVAPEIALISAGANNSYGHPAPETLERLEELGAEIHRTDREGTVTVRVKDGRVGIH